MNQKIWWNTLGYQWTLISADVCGYIHRYPWSTTVNIYGYPWMFRKYLLGFRANHKRFVGMCLPFVLKNMKNDQQLSNMIVLHFGLVTFRFGYGRDHPSFPWFRDFQTCPWAPQPILFIFGDTRMPHTIQEKPTSFKTNYYVQKSCRKHVFCQFWKRRAPKQHEDPS